MNRTVCESEEPLRCAHCGQVIGVYEPMVTLSGDVPVRTSRAALANKAPLTGERFHSGCFAVLDAD